MSGWDVSLIYNQLFICLWFMLRIRHFWPYFMVLHIHQSDCESAVVHHNVKYFSLYLCLLFVLFSFYVSPLQFTKLRIQTILRICQKS